MSINYDFSTYNRLINQYLDCANQLGESSEENAWKQLNSFCNAHQIQSTLISDIAKRRLEDLKDLQNKIAPKRVAKKAFHSQVKLEAPAKTIQTLTNQKPKAIKGDPKGLLPFYRNERPNRHGFTLEKILKFNDREMERHHDFIQWIFPTRTVSNYNTQAPLLNNALIQAAKSDIKIRKNVIRAFDKMLQYYGLERVGKTVQKARNFNDRKGYWTINGKHNLLRMTRIIISLRELGFEEEAQNFGRCISNLAKNQQVTGIPTQSIAYWENAMQ